MHLHEIITAMSEWRGYSMSTTAALNSTETRALKLLGSGLGPEAVAAACGVSVSRISQLLSDTEFAAEVASLRYDALNKHNERDAAYDALEDKLLVQLKASIPLLMRPMEITRVLSAINAAKRRGQSSPDSVLNQQTVVSLVLPVKIMNKFSVNLNNQVISAGDQELVTIQSSELKNMSSARLGNNHENVENRAGIDNNCPASP